jgi:drug/metabolite transporter (DMT)-like permease
MNPTRPGGMAAWLSAPWLPVAVLLFSSSMWGLSWLPLKAFAEHGLSGPLLAMLTYGLLGVVGLPWLWRERALWLRDKRLLLALVVLGGWGNAAFVSALVLGDVVRVMLLFYLAPVWSVLGGRFFLGESVSPRRAGAVALALIGAFLVVGGFSVFEAPLSAADLFALTSGMGFAGNNIVSRAAQRMPTATKTVGLCIGCALMALLMMAVTGPAAPAVSMPSAGVIAGLLAYSLIGLALVIVTWQWSVTHLEAGRSGVLAIAELLVAMLTATLIGDETMLPREWLGAALIVAAAVLEATDSAESACPPNAITPKEIT